METFLFYSGKVIFTSGVMFLYYQLFLKDKTFHHYNRFYLLAVMLVSLLLPLLKVSYFTVEVNSDIYLLINTLKNSNSNTIGYDFSYFKIIAVGFGLLSVFFLTKFAIGIAKISGFKNHFPKEEIEGINFYRTNLDNAPFSYFRNLFWKNSILIQSDLGKQILKHEMVHIEQKHTLDKIFIETIKSIFWFNPFFYLIHKEIHLIHEYLADKKAVKQSDTKAFAQMLLASHFSGEMLPATSPFLSSNLKKRLKMLKTPKTKFSYARRIFALPLLFVIAFAYLVNAKNKEIKATNIEIAKAVQQIKSDTIKADIVPIPEELEKSTESAIKKLDKNDKDIADLRKKIQEKSKELKTLSPDSKEFSDKIEEINSLSGKISDIASSQKLINNVWVYSGDGEFFDSAEFNGKMQENMKKIQEKFNSKEFKEQMAKNQEFFNSDEWKNTVKQLENINFEMPNITIGKDGTKVFSENPKIFFKNDSDRVRVFGDHAKLSAEQKKEISKIAKEQSKLAKKQADLAKKQAELAKKQAKISGNQRKVMVLKNAPNTIYFNTNDLKGSNITDGVKIYIDGKLSTREEMNKLDPEKIDHMNVNKNSNNGKESGEIRITTKK